MTGDEQPPTDEVEEKVSDRVDSARSGHRERKFYGRRHGKTLRKGHADLLATRLEALSLRGVMRSENPDRAPLDLDAVFGAGRDVWLEIGFGAGEHLVHQALSNPRVGLIGAEAFINGVAALLARIEKAGADNIALHAGDARDLLDVIPEGRLARVFLLYPDPWPKTRHRRRRFIAPENLDALARAMEEGASLRLATDIPDYVAHAVRVFTAHSAFGPPDEDPATCHTPWPDWTRTRYEAKALREGRTPHYLTFRRRATFAAARRPEPDGRRPDGETESHPEAQHPDFRLRRGTGATGQPFAAMARPARTKGRRADVASRNRKRR